MLKNNLPLIIIILAAAILRFYNLGKVPPSLNWDEVAHGYNAYSILKTTRDEYGAKMPLYFRSFDDYKPPLYTYLVVIPVAVFGLSGFAVRFPSALLGTFSVILTYLFLQELFKKKEIALLSALFLAISPWSLQFSRVAYEANTAIFWVLAGTLTFLKGLNSTKKSSAVLLLSISALYFGAGLFTYHSVRVFIPLLVIALFILHKDRLLKIKTNLILPAAITIFILYLLVPIMTSKSGQFRLKGTTIFQDNTPITLSAEKIVFDSNLNIGQIARILHNRRLAYLPRIIENYFSHLNPNYLFFRADDNTHHAPETGLLLLWDLPFILAGIYFLIKNNFGFKSKITILLWFIFAPVAASVTVGEPNSIRSEIYLPSFQIFTAIGFYYLYLFVRKNKVFLGTSVILLIFNFMFYLHQYYVHLPAEFSKDWLYGRQEAVLFTENVKNNYDRVIVSTKLEQPHEFWLFYSKYDPKKYQSEGGTTSGGFLETGNKFDKYQFMPINFDIQKTQAKTLFVGVPQDFPKNIKPLDRIYYLNGEPAIYIVSGQ